MTQIEVHFHPSRWFLVPFRPAARIRGTWVGTWLFVTLTCAGQ